MCHRFPGSWVVSQVCRKFTAPSANLQISPVDTPSHDNPTRSPYPPGLFEVSGGWSNAKLFVVLDGPAAMFDHAVWCHRLSLIMVVIPGDRRPDGLSQSVACFVVIWCRGHVHGLMCRTIVWRSNSCSWASPERIPRSPAPQSVREPS